MNEACSSWYNQVGDHLSSIWERRKILLYKNGSSHEVDQANPTIGCEINGINCYDGCYE